MGIDTHLFEAIQKRLQLRMYEMKFDGISENFIHLPMPHFKTVFYRTRSKIPTRINSTTNTSSRFSLRGPPRFPVFLRNGWAKTDETLGVDRSQ